MEEEGEGERERERKRERERERERSGKRVSTRKACPNPMYDDGDGESVWLGIKLGAEDS